MANVAEIKVVVDVPQGEAIKLMQAMALEIIELYQHLDEVAAMVDGAPYPRNRVLIDAVEAFVDGLQAKQVTDREASDS